MPPMLWVLLIGCHQPVTFVPDGPDSTAACDGPTWEGFGEGFFRTWCRSCHSATTPDRRGAPEALDYDTYEQVVAGAETIRDAVLVRGSMPLGGGVHADDLDQLEAFLDCPTTGDGDAADVGEWAPTPTLDAAGVQAAIDAAFPVGDVPNPMDARDRLVVWLEHSDFSCPVTHQLSTSASWDGCYAGGTGGYWFSGLSVFDGDAELHGVGAFSLQADFNWRDPDDNPFDAGGVANVERGDDGSATLQLTGTWSDATATGWVEDFSGAWDATVEHDTLTWTGSIARGDAAIHLDVVVTEACTDGVVGVRDVDGWHTLELTCGCGPWTFEGTSMGETCVDLGDRLAPLVQATGVEEL